MYTNPYLSSSMNPFPSFPAYQGLPTSLPGFPDTITQQKAVTDGLDSLMKQMQSLSTQFENRPPPTSKAVKFRNNLVDIEEGGPGEEITHDPATACITNGNVEESEEEEEEADW